MGNASPPVASELSRGSTLALPVGTRGALRTGNAPCSILDARALRGGALPMPPTGRRGVAAGARIAPPGPPFVPLGPPIAPLGRPIAPLGRPFAPLGGPIASLGRPFAPLGRPFAFPFCAFGPLPRRAPADRCPWGLLDPSGFAEDRHAFIAEASADVPNQGVSTQRHRGHRGERAHSSRVLSSRGRELPTRSLPARIDTGYGDREDRARIQMQCPGAVCREILLLARLQSPSERVWQGRIREEPFDRIVLRQQNIASVEGHVLFTNVSQGQHRQGMEEDRSAEGIGFRSSSRFRHLTTLSFSVPSVPL